jgi:C-terminal processing protease CtpA/Prc
LFVAGLLFSCTSVKKYNQHLETPVAAEKLKKDADFAYKKLQKFHPNLYWFIPKDSLDLEFENLKNSINTPLKPAEFYQKLMPVITKIREGHQSSIIPYPRKRLTKKEQKKYKDTKSLLGRMEYVLDGKCVFVKENIDDFDSIKIGTEILKINDVPVSDYLEKYEKFVSSDGFNTTFQKYILAARLERIFTAENGILDSIKLQTRYSDEVKDFYIHLEKIDKTEKKKKKKTEKEISKNPEQKNKDYNPANRSFNRDLKFLDQDSSIAYMKIKTFSGVKSKNFYKESFETLQKTGSKYLIIDIRNNTGGSLSEIRNLYSYLAVDKVKLINDMEVTGRSSIHHADYPFNSFLAVVYPFYFVRNVFATKSKDGKFYLRGNKAKTPKETAFHGKIYLLVNGMSFSASSIISSKLKNDKRAVLVGEETGGTNDGTVAGQISTTKLPNSKLYFPVWLMFIQPNIEFTNTKKGVTPDVEILPTLEEILQKKDVELEWILKDIEAEK